VRGANAVHAAGRRAEAAYRISQVFKRLWHGSNLTVPVIGSPAKESATGPGRLLRLGSGFVSGVVVAHVVRRMMDGRVMAGRVGLVLRVMVLGGEGRAGKDHQQQGGGKNLFHGKNVAQERRQRKRNERREPREERLRRAVSLAGKQRKLKAR
jgi:hypothetical protein